MRMLVLAALAMTAAPLAAAPAKYQVPSVAAKPDHCPRAMSYQAYNRGKVAKPRKLNELPGAHQFAAVYRVVNGCQVPLIVRYNIGG